MVEPKRIEIVDLTSPMSQASNKENDEIHICLSDNEEEDGGVEALAGGDESVIIVDDFERRVPESEPDIVILGSTGGNQNFYESDDEDEQDYGSELEDDDVEVISSSSEQESDVSEDPVTVSPSEMPNSSQHRDILQRIQETLDRNVALQLQQEERDRISRINNRNHQMQVPAMLEFADIHERLMQRLNQFDYNSRGSSRQSHYSNNPFRPQPSHSHFANSQFLAPVSAGGGMNLSDSASYEELLALEERMGSVKVGLSEFDISRLPVFAFSHKDSRKSASSSNSNVYNNDGGDADGVSCPICLLEFDVGDMVMLLNPCMHSFHEECCKKWLRENKSCPVCREQVHVSASDDHHFNP